jgi:hypothetical protein
MSVPGLTTMQQLLDAAISEVDEWQRSSAATEVPAHRVTNLRDKLQALRGVGSVGLLRSGVSHIYGSIALLGVPASELAPSLLQLASLLGKRKGRNRYVGSWTETGWRDISLPFTRESLVTVLSWAAGEQPSTHSHQDIAHWCDRLHTAWATDTPHRDALRPLVGIAEDVSVQWELYLANTYTLEQLQAFQFSTIRLPVEWFQAWLRRARELTL